MSGNKGTSDQTGFGRYASVRIVAGIVIGMGCLWLFSTIISFFSGTPEGKSPYKQVVEQYPALQKADGWLASHDSNAGNPDEMSQAQENLSNKRFTSNYSDGEGVISHSGMINDTADVTPVPRPVPVQDVPVAVPAVPAPLPAIPQVRPRQVIGTAFVDALCRPLQYELDGRFWGWRPNDLWITKLGMDNVENFQLGLIEMTRRSVNVLSERISRTGTNVYINENLQKARSNLNIDPGRFWFPSAENEYKRAIDQLKAYIDDVSQGKAYFFTRSDNLIPLLIEFRNQLGDCDNKLIRMESDPKTQVSTFEADNLFYYSKGVASVILPLLKAIEEDFNMTLKSRDGIETLHHAIEACEGAAHLSPWIVFEGDYDGFFANHRANMSTYISHARFYIGVLITSLAT
ncbi:hypothetical protein JCM14469_41900 [Desulfatiferula olefinivorans]